MIGRKARDIEEWDDQVFAAIREIQCRKSKNGLRNFMPSARAGQGLPLDVV